MAEVNNEKLHIRLHVYKKSEHTISLMTLIDIALLYERERSKNDTAPYDTILSRLTSEIEEALK